MAKDLIDSMGEIIDKAIEENEIKMLITIPENSMEIQIDSTFGSKQTVFNFYILLHAVKKIVNDLVGTDQLIDESKKELLVDELFGMLKKEIMEE